MPRSAKLFVGISFFFAACFAGCLSKKEILSKVWFFTYRREISPGDNINDDTSVNQLLKGVVLTPIDFFSLQPDGAYTSDMGQFAYGNWSVGDHDITFRNANGETSRLTWHLLSGKEMLFKVSLGNGGALMYHFGSWPMPFKNPSDNPFSKENNLWRIKAAQKENDNMIAARLRNHFKYWEKYFSWGLEIQITTLDVRSLPGPLKLYGNGFQLIPLSEWLPRWRQVFYDEEDCIKAYDKLKYFFNHENISWAKTDNKFKMFISAFQQMQDKMK